MGWLFPGSNSERAWKMGREISQAKPGLMPSVPSLSPLSVAPPGLRYSESCHSCLSQVPQLTLGRGEVILSSDLLELRRERGREGDKEGGREKVIREGA